MLLFIFFIWNPNPHKGNLSHPCSAASPPSPITTMSLQPQTLEFPRSSRADLLLQPVVMPRGHRPGAIDEPHRTVMHRRPKPSRQIAHHLSRPVSRRLVPSQPPCQPSVSISARQPVALHHVVSSSNNHRRTVSDRRHRSQPTRVACNSSRVAPTYTSCPMRVSHQPEPYVTPTELPLLVRAILCM